MNTCYACGLPGGRARDVAGTTYWLCDCCWHIHITYNRLAVIEARRQLGKAG